MCWESRPVVFQLSDLQGVYPAQQLLIHVHREDVRSDRGLANVVNTLRGSAQRGALSAHLQLQHRLSSETKKEQSSKRLRFRQSVFAACQHLRHEAR